MTTSAERLIQIAHEDYRMQSVTGEQLVSIIVDCCVAMAFRTGRTPSDVIEDVWKTVIPDERWRQLIEQDRLNQDE